MSGHTDSKTLYYCTEVCYILLAKDRLRNCLYFI